MANQDCTEFCSTEFTNWLSELFAVTEAMEYVLALISDEHTVLSNTLTLFQQRMAVLLIQGYERWDGSDFSIPIRRLAAEEC